MGVPNFLRRTLFFTRLVEVCEARAALRRAQHRASIRLKRAAVCARLKQELHRIRIERVTLELQRAQAAARVQGLARVAELKMKRDALMKQKLAQHGCAMPRKGIDVAVETEGDRLFKQAVVQRVEKIIGERDGMPVARRVATDVLKDTVANVNIAGLGDNADRSLKMVAAVAKSAGIEWDQMEHLLHLVEPDPRKRRHLTHAVRDVMENEDAHTSHARVVDETR